MTAIDTERKEQDVARALVARISGGDLLAEAELVERYSRGLLTLLRRRCGDAMLAEDLHQECLSIVIIRLRDRSIEEPAKLIRFIQKTAANLYVAHMRKLNRRNTTCDSERIDEIADRRNGPESNAALDQTRHIVRRLLDELPVDRDRQVLRRFFLYEEDKESICNDLGITKPQFNTVVFRARQRFAELLRKGDMHRHLQVVK